MARDKREYAFGTYLIVDYPFGFYVAGRAVCSDGHIRNLKRIAVTADTYFSVPAAVEAKGKTVSGYVTVSTLSGSDIETDGDPAIVKFIAYSYGKNGSLLPDGAWKRED